LMKQLRESHGVVTIQPDDAHLHRRSRLIGLRWREQRDEKTSNKQRRHETLKHGGLLDGGGVRAGGATASDCNKPRAPRGRGAWRVGQAPACHDGTMRQQEPALQLLPHGKESPLTLALSPEGRGSREGGLLRSNSATSARWRDFPDPDGAVEADRDELLSIGA